MQRSLNQKREDNMSGRAHESKQEEEQDRSHSSLGQSDPATAHSSTSRKRGSAAPSPPAAPSDQPSFKKIKLDDKTAAEAATGSHTGEAVASAPATASSSLSAHSSSGSQGSEQPASAVSNLTHRTFAGSLGPAPKEHSVKPSAGGPLGTSAGYSSPATSLPPLSPSRLLLLTRARSLLVALLALRRLSIADCRSKAASFLTAARAQLKQTSLALQQLISQPPPLTPAMLQRIDALRNSITQHERRIAHEEKRHGEDEKKHRMLCAQLQGAESDALLPPHQLICGLAHGIWVHFNSWSVWPPSDIPPRLLSLQRRWTSQAGELLQLLAAGETQAKSQVISCCAAAGHLAAAERMLQLTGDACVLTSLSRGHPLSALAKDSSVHFVCLSPLLRLLRYGLDPTLVGEGDSKSALQMARSHAIPPNTLDELDSLAQSLEQLSRHDDDSPRDPAADYLLQQSALTAEEEQQRRKALHTRFMQALLSAWRDHSSAVRALLLEAAPNLLIPDLVNICAEYLDLDPADKRMAK